MRSATVTPLPRVPGYIIEEQIYSGARTAVYRALTDSAIADKKGSTAGRSVVIKMLQSPYPSFKDLSQFCNQYNLTRSLSIKGVPQPLALEPWQNGYLLITEDFKGCSLQTYAKENQLSHIEVLRIGIQLASILHELAQHQIVHKDIKPANILIHAESKEIQLIDFSIASRLPKEKQSAQNPNRLEGTLAYLAPEQTGRMNRAIDYRTDFYSLGVTLYELLSGSVPFETTDPLALVHCHIAKAPTDLCAIDRSISPTLSAIVLKLMAKSAEDRYQSALGLKHDLETCLEQLMRTGRVAEFSLGERDSSDRFSISEKLYGREREVESLLNAYERVVSGDSPTELTLVAGTSGIGKTVVVSEVHKPLTRQQGFFISGKFDQLNRSTPLSAFLQAIEDLISQILAESDEQIRSWRNRVLAALGDEAQRLVEIMPALEQLIGRQPAVPELSISESQNRFNALFQRFIAIFTSSQRPLVLFLDDVQWIDLASLRLLQQLIEQQTYLLILGAYRDNEVSAAHPFMMMVETLQHSSIVNSTTLSPLSKEDTHRLIADSLRCSVGQAYERLQPLSELIHRKTKGNPFFTTQFLKSLYEDGHIRFNAELASWECDMASLSQRAFTDDVVGFMVQRLKKLPAQTQNILAIAACIGNRFDLSTLAIAAGQPPQEAANLIWTGLEEELIVCESGTYTLYERDESHKQNDADSESDYKTRTLEAQQLIDSAVVYKFLHDRIQQAAYELIAKDPEQQQAIHLVIGQRLLADSSDQKNVQGDTENSDRLFRIVSHLNKGCKLITESADRQELAQLNLVAGERAKASGDYQTAMECLLAGIHLLPANSWQDSTTLSLHESMTEASLLAGDLEQMQHWADVVLSQAIASVDKAKVYEIQIQAATSQGQLADAIAIAREALSIVGITLPQTPTPSDIQQSLQQTESLLQNHNIAELAQLPAMTNTAQIAIIRLTAATIPAAFMGMPALFPLLVCIQIQTLIQHGNSTTAAYSYASYGLLLNAILNDVESAQHFANLAITLLDQTPSQTIQGQTHFVVSAFITHHTHHLKLAQHQLCNSYQLALESGIHEYVGYAAFHICNNDYLLGTQLSDLSLRVEAYCQVLLDLKQNTMLTYCQIVHQSVRTLLQASSDESEAADESQLIDESNSFDETAAIARMQTENNLTGLYSLYFHKLVLSFLFTEISAADDIAKTIRNYLAGGSGFSVMPVFYFYDSLVALNLCANLSSESSEAQALLSRVEENKGKLTHWATYAPMNYQHKLNLIAAEQHRIQNEPYLAMEKYDLAIAQAKQQGFIQEEALANELAAQFYLSRHKQQIAAGYLKEAYYGYSRWGAAAKIAQLEATYPEVLSMIGTRSPNGTITTQQTLTPVTLKSITNTSSYQNMWLDFSSVSQAAQAISQEIELNKLLEALMAIVITNAGAQNGCFILAKDGAGTANADGSLQPSQREWQIVAQANQNHITIKTTPLEQNTNIPQRLIHSVIRTQEPALFENLSADSSFRGDRYISKQKPLSALCMPISKQNTLIGILYLENNASEGVFSRDRLKTLQLLMNQAAISLENASLYQKVEQHSQQLEAEVNRKTQALNEKVVALENTLVQLKETQAQLVQTEKMSSLGQLVAGVAHEINNPVNFIHANVKHIERYNQELMHIIKLYQQHCHPQQPESVQEAIEDIDLEFLEKDAQHLLMSIQHGSDRIKDIVISLRNFSRLDEATYKQVDIHEGIESTLTLLQHRLRATRTRADIKVMRSYGDLPEINCYPGLLNQVFINLLNNAIDAIDSNPIGGSGADELIEIRSEMIREGWITVRILDSGSGIAQDVRSRIFEPFFTTKPVGQGQGLGLSISYQIITEKHGGRIYQQENDLDRTELVIELPVQSPQHS